MVRGRRLDIAAWETIAAALALAAGFHFLAIRVRAGGLPQGDEGSWLSVAAELARGGGFGTRWLEFHFLVPYQLPRPDDFRYPALTSLLAASFRCFGISVEAARWTVAAVFLAFASAAWLVCRSAFGRWPGLAALWLTVFSLLQLEWNSAVYTEGLFGLGTALLAAWCLRGRREGELAKPAWWAVLGLGTGLLYLIRVNGILFVPGLLWLYRSHRKTLSWKLPALALACFFLAASPWLIRSAVHFGNPFHVAGSAGMLREAGQSHTYSAVEYFSRHDAWFPLQRMLLGLLRFFATLRHYEHGLEMAPLLLAAAAAFLGREFFGPFPAAGFLLTFLASCYASYDSWAGVRYMTGLMPFVYAYGLSLVPGPARALAAAVPEMPPRWVPRAKGLVGAAGILALLLPVVGPHRFYERRFSGTIARPSDLPDHLRRLEARVPPGGRYYAGSLCRVNFLSPGRDCVGLQELYDTTWFSRSMAAFHPSLVILAHEETEDAAILAALMRMQDAGYLLVPVDSGTLGIYLALSRAPQDSIRNAGL
ncbi:MAG TPA: glycosyltransferase family 39 protein [Fibrobacteria bacterium]|nr:glycosyltransferase family 39 protein [Fibrobacteria bacterium]